MSKKKKMSNRTLWSVMITICAVMLVGVVVYAMDMSGTVDEFKSMFGNTNTNTDESLGGSGGTSHTRGSFDIEENLIVGGTATITGLASLGADSINYTEIDPDACAIQWVECTETASSGGPATGANINVNPCEYTNATGGDQYVVEVGWITASGADSDTARIDVDYGTTASDSVNSDPAKIFDKLDLSTGKALSWAMTTALMTASDSASVFQPFVLSDGDSIFASQSFNLDGDAVVNNVNMGDLEFGEYTMWFKWCDAPTGYLDIDLDS